MTGQLRSATDADVAFIVERARHAWRRPLLVGDYGVLNW